MAESVERVNEAGTKEWRNAAGQYHRLDGPAVEYPNGLKVWLIQGKLHRKDGPAFEHPNGRKEWWRNGKLHRTDGPAVETATGNKEYWLNDKKVTEQEVMGK